MVANYEDRNSSMDSAESSCVGHADGIKEESMDIIYEISKILNTGLDRPTLAILVDLCEKGVDPTVLAYMVKHLKEAKKNFLSNLIASRMK
ncbi:hypothetical protein X943_001346 [Babesia divergens]|uniref:Mitotic-spindle organizing protein 1 n=1 Tax=Babesia divergens TaxID=32595 RepID=A0AAD9G6Z7_BABDI|nr:hypothetical protein X943_001346 [Babesia divergens]